MKLPISFDEVAYFKNEFRGDLIITERVLYYFPHTRVNYARYSDELGGKEAMVVFDLLGNVSSIFSVIPTLRIIADKGIKTGKFLKRAFRPTIDIPQIRKIRLWHQSMDSEKLQQVLDNYITKLKVERLSFDEDAIPKPIRFSADEIESPKFGLKFKFDSKYDNHDFRVNLIHRNKFKKALQLAGFIK